MSENISVTFKGSARSLFDDTQNEMQAHGGTITGDTNSGSFKIPVPFSSPATGTYTVSGQTVNICIIHKPFYISTETIRQHIQDYLDNQPSDI